MGFLHGTSALLEPGHELVPGDDIGVSHYGRSEHVYMTSTGFSMSDLDYVPTGIHSVEQYSLWSALQWAAYAADNMCDPQECEYVTDVSHSNQLSTWKNVPECVHVYEVEPSGPVEFDDAHDCEPDGVRARGAQVLREITFEEIKERLGWW